MGGIFSQETLTPAMRQYKALKRKYPDCLLLFRMGDFYETFYEDAVLASKVLGITLTSRGKGEKRAPLAGIPYKASNTYIQKLINQGLKVAIAEQIEDPRTVKGRIVARDVVRVITPGTVIEEGLLDKGRNNYIIGLYSNGDAYGLACADITTGEFFCCRVDGFDRVVAELKKLHPAEVVIPESLAVNTELLSVLKGEGIFITKYDDYCFAQNEAELTLKQHFKTTTLGGFGLAQKPLLVCAAGGLLSYLKETQKQSLKHISRVHVLNIDDYMVLDATTLRNLEIFENIVDRSTKNSLISTIDYTITPMGARLLRKWLQRPLLSPSKIRERQNAVAYLLSNTILREEIRGQLKGMCDIERIVGKLSYNTITPKDVVALGNSLKQLPKLVGLVSEEKQGILKPIADMPLLQELADKILKALKENPPMRATEGGIIRSGYNKELDELRELKESSKEVLKRIEQEEMRKTGIKTLRVGFNQVIGYYIQVSKSYLHRVPSYYIKKQTLVGGERFVTEELKQLESKILGAEERINILEYELFREIVAEVDQNSRALQAIAKRLALLDVLCSLAHAAEKHNYTKPEVNEKGSIIIRRGRHPVVELMEPEFIPNDTHLEKGEMIILTGPNMAGKSTYMRQICLIVILAQIGSFVPAESASIGIVDRIFTRVGAYDDLTHGQSTFMVEMDETANILNNATERSLIILDEVGRGTSTFDGVAIAWAVAEYIYNHIKAKTIFATHYHLLNKLGEEFKNIKNYNIAVKEEHGEIIFLREIREGGTDKSYGIHVAKMAGMPKEVIDRALEIQEGLMEEDKSIGKLKGKKHALQFTLKKWEV
ncbi:DNA mismatch repair protein MutS [Candidatus Woesearchaeota archaeon]|nr:DNA mismatch repair protein MutS [Candidatus Woesearchaeota archaeon]RLE43589.1 MAG: DNA mismatch repair protein MutS [Candidatus Woesearchaeota archaeon]